MENLVSSEILFPVLISFSVALMATYGVRGIAVKFGWISIPREDRWNTRQVALMGGIGVFASFLITFFLFQPIEYLTVGIGASMMFICGLWDDHFEIQPTIKFLIQFLAASVLIGAGYTLNSSWSFWVVLPLTYLWIIGITNAFNLLDNMDGLAAGIAVIASAVFGGLALKLGLPSVAVLAFILVGAAGGFLVFNYHPAKIFMGDCGSLFLGYLLAAFPLMLEPAITNISPASILPVIMAVTILPIVDTTLVTLVRLFKGRSPSQGGSDHTSHRLVISGLSEKAAVNSLYTISISFGIIVLLFYPDFIQLFYLLFTIGVVGIFFLGLYLSRLKVYHHERVSAVEAMFKNIPAYFKQRIQLATIVVDVTLIISSFALAHFIRFESWSASIEEAVIDVLPGVIVLKVFLLAVFGLYKSVWRCAGLADLLRIIMATFLGSLAAGVFAWFYSWGYLSASLFAIDWFLFLFLVACSRFAFKGLRRLFAIPMNGGRNVLLYGAGDAGWLALSEIRQNHKLNMKPIGFIDDSPYKQKAKIQGLRVLGRYHNLHSICEEHNVDEVLICIRDIPDDKKETVEYVCADNGIKCREFLPVFNDLGYDKTSEEMLSLKYQNAASG